MQFYRNQITSRDFPPIRHRLYYLARDNREHAKEFWDEICNDPSLVDDKDELVSNLADAINCDGDDILPKTKYKKLKGCNKLIYKPYEIKSSGHALRVYGIYDEDFGHLLIHGGKKGTQTEDIEKVKKIIKDYQTFKGEQKQ